MTTESPQLPPKPEVALALLQTASSVYVHLDPRAENVHVPSWFKKQPQLVLQVGLNMAVPIPDLDVGHEAISCTLSFNRRAEFCQIPWDAIYGLVGEDGRGMIWPESVPAEVAASAQGRSPVARVPQAARPKLRLAHSSPPPEGEQSVDVGEPSEAQLTTETESEAKENVRAHLASAPSPKEEHIEVEKIGSSIEKAESEDAGVDPAPLVAQKEVASQAKKALPSYLRVVK